MPEREKLKTRLGFILVSAGCAIGLGNVWRFPWMVGEYGGGLFVLIYVFFVVLLGVPIMTTEFAIGRGSQKSIAKAFLVLQPDIKGWHGYSYFAMAGNYLLMMFYTSVVGWVVYFTFLMFRGDFTGANPRVGFDAFIGMITSPTIVTGYMLFTCIFGFVTCALGLQKGVERVTKFMMSCFFLLLLVLVVRAITLPAQPGVDTTAIDGLKFLLIPQAAAFAKYNILQISFAALGQAFFSLSIGIGSMMIFGSYIGKERALAGESILIAGTDTLVSFCSGLLIFPLCFAFGTDPGSGPGLLFMTIPDIFSHMPGGYLWGILFFIFMVFATITTVIAVFENIVAFWMDLWNFSRAKAVAINMVLVPILCLPCALGFNVWDPVFAPMLSWLGDGAQVIDLWDFIVSQNLLPLGSAIFMLFAFFKNGWGVEKFFEEVNAGKGIKMPTNINWYFKYLIPGVIVFVFLAGYYQMFVAG